MIGDAIAEGLALFDHLLGILHALFDQSIGPSNALGQRLQDVERGIGLFLEEVDEVGPFEGEERRDRARIDEVELRMGADDEIAKPWPRRARISAEPARPE